MTPEQQHRAGARPAGRCAYDDLDTLDQMRADCRSAETRLPHPRSLAAAARAAVGRAPSLDYADFPRETLKRDLRIDEAAARLARALHLELE